MKPILKDSVLFKGVYKTKEEFFSNNPLLKEYEFNKEGFLYTKTDQNEWATTREAFGFCNGKNIWINANRSFYLLIRRNDTFEFLANFKIAKLIGSSNFTEPLYNDRSPNMSIGKYTALYTAANTIILLAEFARSYTNKLIYQVNLKKGKYSLRK